MFRSFFQEHATQFDMTHASGGADDESPDPKDAMRAMFGPAQVDTLIRSAISTCWMMMPPGKKTPEAVAAEVGRIVERALANLAEDASAFGFGEMA